MKKLHLICNAHLDPVWMWDWQEGMTAALSTFYQAAELADEFDYIFCHNEAALYEFIEKHDIKLFERIKELVKLGKWHIMGGWYIQPDCHIPSGEAFVRQIAYGRKYFQEKFGVIPTTAINFDSFGHTVGLVQILKKCGYDSYIVCRPMPEMLALPDNVFNWVGLDGCKIKVCRFEDDTIYCSGLGTAKADILRKVAKQTDKEIGIALWGVGNHGGNPSRKDLREINELIKNADYEILHSTPENYFADVTPTKEYAKSLDHCLVGCYSSLSTIKTAYSELERKLFNTEKLCAYVDMFYGYKYDHAKFRQAEREMLFIQFHDILSGTCVVEGLNSSVNRAKYAVKILDEMYFDAFISIVNKFVKAEENSFPIFTFNAFPYKREIVVESEFLVLDALVSDTEEYAIKAIYKGKEIPCQIVKQSSNINYDRRKKVACKIVVEPFTMAQVNYYVEKRPLVKKDYNMRDLLFEDVCKKVVIGKDSGLIESLVVGGKEYLSGGAFLSVMFDDIADPWGWGLKRVGKNPVPFTLSKNEIFGNLKTVNIVEDGVVYTEVESYFERNNSFVKISYKIYKDLPYIDVDLYVLWNEKEKALKIKIPSVLKSGVSAQTAFGTEKFSQDGEEHVSHRFISINDEDENVLSLYNKNTYGFSTENGELFITLLRGVAYCAHPIEDRPLLPWERFVPYAEQSKHEFSFRLSVDKAVDCERNAAEFTASDFTINAYPHGDGDISFGQIYSDNPNIVLKAFKKSENGGYVLRLINNYSESQRCAFRIIDNKIDLKFSPYEVKTLFFNGKTLTESEKLTT